MLGGRRKGGKMRKRTLLILVLAGLVGLLVAGCDSFLAPQAVVSPAAVSASGRNYIVICRSTALPSGFSAAVSAAGGTITHRFGSVGAAAVSAAGSSFVSKMSAVAGVQYVVPDVKLDWLPDQAYSQAVTKSASVPAVAADSYGSTEPYFGYQWDMQAIDAAGAWATGDTGAGVRVAVLDTGIDPTHPDLASNLDKELSKSFVPYEPTIVDHDGHGTNVAGIIAAAKNGVGVIGVAPNAQIVAVKVLDGTGSGDLSWVIEGILYANAVGAKVINMSLGAYLPRQGFVAQDGTHVTADDVAGFLALMTRVVNSAWSNGSLLVAAAGNESVDLTGDQGLVHLPSDVGRTLCISATGPQGWGLDPSVNLDTPAVYTNYGSAIDLAAPGGNIDPTLYANDTPGWWFDLVFGDYPMADGGYVWMAGTSQATPHVSGIAALIIAAHHGNIGPTQVESILERTANDLGKPGRDPWYGLGEVNAAAAVK
jgi:lantibiotic leader peptide-processing serine protease